jgi:hypothetical protein
MDALNKENLMPLLGFGPQFPVHPLYSPDFSKIFISLFSQLYKGWNTQNLPDASKHKCVLQETELVAHTHVPFLDVLRIRV